MRKEGPKRNPDLPKIAIGYNCLEISFRKSEAFFDMTSLKKIQKILLTNDDGIHSPGIQALAAALRACGRDFVVVAPDRERSSTGHAITMHRPLKAPRINHVAYPVGAELYACDGLPTDCVTLGLEVLCPQADFVISGINQGANVGDDVTYSGTVMAALEGLILRRAALAVSLVLDPPSAKEPAYNETAARLVVRLLDRLESGELSVPEGVLLNLNVPNVPDEPQVALTHRGYRVYEDKFSRLHTPSGAERFWLGGRCVDDDSDEGSDVWAHARGMASLTPIHPDMTHYATLEKLRNTFPNGLFKKV